MKYQKEKLIFQYNNKRKCLSSKNIKIIKTNKLNNKNDFNSLLELSIKLERENSIETGLTFLNKLIKFGFWSDLYIFKSNKLLNKWL